MQKMLPIYDPNDNEAGLKLLEDLATNAHQIQEEVLKEILTKNAHTEYLGGFLNGLLDKDKFKKEVPIVNYQDIKLWIERIANGEPSTIISAQPITELLTSSGTSGGQPKMMPSTAEDLDLKTFFYNLLVPVMNKYVDGLDQGKGMCLLFIKPESMTPSGLMARPVLTSYYKSSNFRNRPFNRYNVYTSPDEIILCPDSKQSMYCQLLCGLVQRDEVLRVGAVFASALLRAIKFLEDYWKEMCFDIRAGHVSDWITDPSCRNAFSSLLSKPDAKLGDLIEHECSKKSWDGIIKRIWPKTKFVEVVVTAYFEFLPVTQHNGEVINDVECSDGKEDEKVKMAAVDLADVKLGHCYELVVTTFTGLYRYRVEDILMVTGFHNSAPQFQFVQRRNVVLSIDTDKTSEEDLLKAISRATLLIKPLGLLLTEYAGLADTSSIPGHYVIFWELKARGNNGPPAKLDPVIMEECCSAIEESLDSVYRRCRSKDKSIAPLEIRVVQDGTFYALMDFCVSRGSSVNQYKTPRCIKSVEALRLLDSRVLQRFCSKKDSILGAFRS